MPSPLEHRLHLPHQHQQQQHSQQQQAEDGQDQPGQQPPKVKCVLVGDGAIGKTSLIVSYTTNGYPTEYVPTAFDNYSVVVSVNNKPVSLQLCDTAGQDDFDSLRPLCYPNTDVFLLCFSVVCPSSFHNILDKWLPEVRQHSPKTPIILIGTQCDLRNDVKILIELARYKEAPIAEADAQRLACQIGAYSYIECSALTQKNLKEVFDSAIISALNLGKPTLPSVPSGKSKLKKINPDVPPHKRKKGWKKFFCVF
uniref:Rho-related GTP-binding protein RhoU n=2 Tax=Octopus bimaculoides TaxID=37653 RepID=A0A0L8H8T6_OCTBM